MQRNYLVRGFFDFAYQKHIAEQKTMDIILLSTINDVTSPENRRSNIRRQWKKVKENYVVVRAKHSHII